MTGPLPVGLQGDEKSTRSCGGGRAGVGLGASVGGPTAGRIFLAVSALVMKATMRVRPSGQLGHASPSIAKVRAKRSAQVRMASFRAGKSGSSGYASKAADGSIGPQGPASSAWWPQLRTMRGGVGITFSELRRDEVSSGESICDTWVIYWPRGCPHPLCFRRRGFPRHRG